MKRAPLSAALLALVSLIVSTSAEASRASGASAVAASQAHAPGVFAPEARAVERALALGDGALDETDTPQLALFAGHELDGTPSARARSFRLDGAELPMPPLASEAEPSYPETRVRAFDFLGQEVIGVERELSLTLHWGSGVFGLELASGSGEWLSEDPAGTIDSPSLYAFVGNRPNLATDPTGTCAGLDNVPCSEYGSSIANQFLNPWESWGNVKRTARFAAFEVKGAALAVPRLAQGLYQLGRHPIQTIEALGTAAGELIGDFPGSVHSAGNALLNVDPDKLAEFTGETLAFAGLGAATKTVQGAAALRNLKNAVGFGGLKEAAAAGIADYSTEVARLSALTAAPSVSAGVGTAATAAAGATPLQILQGVTDTVAARLAANPALGLTVMSPAERGVARVLPFVARMQYGNAVERLVAVEIRATPALRAMFTPVGGPFRPDFVGRIGSPAIGMTFDITTQAARARHLVRPYSAGLGIVTYTRPAGFTLFP